jgi:fructan beta-fructosidase
MRLTLIFSSLLLIFSAVTGQSAYKEKHRPQFHFSPPAHWMNDPNGMVYYKGEYHLFYQYYPDSSVWGPMHWGHAITTDLVHWKHLPVALYPDSLGYIFSGSVVVDKNNTSGFQTGVEKALVAIFTYHDIKGEKAGRNNYQTQGIAYSNDKGRTWKKYRNNPVVANPGIKDFRDPKVSWHALSKKWIMTMAAGDHIRFYTSTNLKDWNLSGTFGKEGNHGGVWECPDLIELPVEKTQQKKWLLLVSIGTGAPNGGSGTQYFVGDFDGKTFHNSNPKQTQLWIDYGCDNYAGVTWSNAPAKRQLFLGWMSNWQYAQTVPTKTWRSAMTIPRDLSLRSTQRGICLFSSPAKELQTLRSSSRIVDSYTTIYPFSLGELKLDFDLDQTDATEFGIEIFNAKNEKVQIGFNKKSNQFYIDRSKSGEISFEKNFAAKHIAPRSSKDKKLAMHLFIDHSSVELFADDGGVVITDVFFPSDKFTGIRLYQRDGSAKLTRGKLYELRSVWK